MSKTRDEKPARNIKTIKYPIITNNYEYNIFEKWVKLGKECYNILNEQQRLAEAWNLKKYYEANPEELKKRQEKEQAYQEKIQKQIESGKRLPKKKRETVFYSPVQNEAPRAKRFKDGCFKSCIRS